MTYRFQTFLSLSRLVALLGCIATLAACTSAPRYRKPPAAGTEVTVEDRTMELQGRDVVESAERFLGTPYRMGGTTAKGMDCSGLVYTVYKDFGIALPRTSQGQSRFGEQVGQGSLARGDLVFFSTGKGSKVSHVGIYAGSGQFIHASTRSKRVKYDRMDNKYFRNRYVTARRVM
jgi:cell wall-associated NlpC family hydrolase